jgi:lipid-A-disaccharide synthase
VANSADLLLCLYPFEPAFYERSPIEAVFVGHPLADEIEPEQASRHHQRKARELLNLDPDRTVLAVLPGSRRGEVKLMAPHFIEAAERFVRMQPGAQVVVPCLHESLAELLQEELRAYPDLPLVVHQGNARLPLQACDVALVKSGTSTLEAMLLHRPMVVSYRLGGLSYQLARRLLRTPFIALPNILAAKMLVPELLQNEGTGEALARALLHEWRASRESDQIHQEFAQLHESLRQNADAQAAAAMVRFLSR